MSSAAENHHSHTLLNVIQDLFLFQHVKSPTRYRLGQLPSTLDLILTNEEHMLSNLEYTLGLGKSDHECLKFKLVCYADTIVHDTRRPNLNKGDYIRMSAQLAAFDCESVSPTSSIQDAWSNFRLLFNKAVNDCVPFMRPKQAKKQKYTTSEVSRMRRDKKVAWHNYKESLSSSSHLVFKRARNELRSITRHLRRNYEKALLEKSKENPKAF